MSRRQPPPKSKRVPAVKGARLTPETDWADAFFASLEEKPLVRLAANAVNRTPQAIWERRRNDAAFGKRYDQFWLDMVDEIEAAAHAKAALDIDSKAGVQLAQFILKTRRREIYGDRVEIAGKLGVLLSPASVIEALEGV